jgi:N6-L-threonylcarbamoyladenine synthase
MLVLAIETSCDDTAVCVLESEGTGVTARFTVRGNVTSSQAHLHAEHGGVFPTLAKREHARNGTEVLKQALVQAEICAERAAGALLTEKKTVIEHILSREPDLCTALIPFLDTHSAPPIDRIVVTVGPGLEPALWVGINLARALSVAWDMPLVPVHHMEGHILISLLQNESIAPVQFPLLSLLVSGGHTEIDLSENWLHYTKIGETQDDAAGEAYDKVARVLGLAYPGGPRISALATQARLESLVLDKAFPRPMLGTDDFHFSFSGLKTSVRTYVEKNPITTEKDRMKIARAFEDAAVDVLVHKTLNAVAATGARSVAVGGGVSANTHLRTTLSEKLATDFPDVTLYIPEIHNSTDNALMIALAGTLRAHDSVTHDSPRLTARGTWPITNI